MSCCNADGGFGSRPNAESHAGLIYCCVGFLSVTKHLHLLDTEKLCWWLCERQLPSGGLNGRPEKLPDVCYSWWVLSSLTIMGRLHWISAEKLEQFILSCQVSSNRRSVDGRRCESLCFLRCRTTKRADSATELAIYRTYSIRCLAWVLCLCCPTMI